MSSYEKTNGGPFRAGRVLAVDSKFTGEEPVWHDYLTWNDEKFHHVRGQMLRFYNYYLTPADLKPSALEWMSKNGYSEADIDAISSAPSYVPESATCKLCRGALRGMPLKNDSAGTDDLTYVRNHIDDALRDLASGRFAKKESSKKVVDENAPISNPVDRMRAKVLKTVGGDLEAMLDKWILARDSKVEPLNLFGILESYSTPAQGCSPITNWLDRQLDEMILLQKGKDEQLSEAYSHLGGKAIRSRIEGLQTMKDDVIKYVAGKKALKTPRKKKTKPAEKQVAKLQYMKSSKDFGLTSISPLSIPGAMHLYVFNAKYKNLIYFQADGPSGLSVKGTTVKGYSEKHSWRRSLRKPLEVLPIVLGKTQLQIEKYCTNLTTKVRTVRGRINDETIILRIAN